MQIINKPEKSLDGAKEDMERTKQINSEYKLSTWGRKIDNHFVWLLFSCKDAALQVRLELVTQRKLTTLCNWCHWYLCVCLCVVKLKVEGPSSLIRIKFSHCVPSGRVRTLIWTVRVREFLSQTFPPRHDDFGCLNVRKGPITKMTSDGLLVREDPWT